MPFFTASSLSAIPELAVVLGIMVVVHELGHFIAAKLCGVRVEAFAIGFGKRLFGVVHDGTDYCVNLIPLGGYVKMTNEMPGELTPSAHPVINPAHTADPGDFQNHPRWQRTFIAVAGPVANFILAFVLLAALYMHHHEVLGFLDEPAAVDYVVNNTPVAATGIQPGDRIVRFDKWDNPTWGELEGEAHFSLNRQTAFSFLHNGRRVDDQIFVENKGHDDDFSWKKLGAIPIMQTTPVEVADVTSSDSPAARAGLQPRDLVLAIDSLHPHSVDAMLAYLQDQAGKPATLTVQRRNASGVFAILRLPVTPVQMDTSEGKGWRLGFQRVMPPVRIERLGFASAFKASWNANLRNATFIFEVLHRLFTRQVSIKAMSSPIGIGVMVHEAFEARDWKSAIIETMAGISLNLGIFNLLPIPILDGGMILFLAVESLIRRDLSQAVKERAYQVAFVCLILFAAVVIFNDITRYLPTHFKT